MKINKNSRFYRYLWFLSKWGLGRGHPVAIENSIPTTVCSLFWFVLLVSMWTFFKIAFYTVAISAIGAFFICALIYPFQPLLQFEIFPTGHIGTAVIMSLVWIIIGLVGLGAYQETDHCQKRRERIYRIKYQKREDGNSKEANQFFSLCYEYIKAVKDKVCPIIKYE